MAAETVLQSDLRGAAGRAAVTPRGWEIELDRGLDEDHAAALLLDLIAQMSEGPSALARWRVASPSTSDERAARSAGFDGDRVILQMSRPLPIDASAEITTRPFRTGRDETAWLELNNLAFAWHPEQGAWALADLEERMAEPWFDPAGFLLHETGDKLDGFCWTKQHQDASPPVGEIYVIAVDPAARGRGLGRALVVAGLDHLHERGLLSAMLFTESLNASAVELYKSLGFEVSEQIRVFERRVGAPAQTPTPTTDPMP